MIWLDLKKLETKLVNNEVPEKEALYCFLLMSAFTSLIYMVIMILSVGEPAPANGKLYFFLEYSYMIVVPTAGLLIAFRINAQHDNRDFLLRAASVGLVAYTWLALTTVCLLFLSFFFVTILRVPIELGGKFAASLPYILIFAFYLMIIWSMRRMKRRSAHAAQQH